MIALEQFLKHGELGPIRVGMGADELMDVLGPPDGRSTGKNPRILKYGGLQLAVASSREHSAHRVISIGLYFQPVEEELPEAIRPEDWQPSSSTTEQDFRDYLDRIGYPPYSSFSEESSRQLVLSSGTNIAFTDSRLHAIQFNLKDSGQRQVSMTIPDETFRAIRDLARSENRTVAELCAEWITEKAAALQLQGGVQHAS